MKCYINQNIIVGVRPENILVAEHIDGCTLNANVLMLEKIGSECYVYFKFADKTCIAKENDINKAIDIGDSLCFRIDEEKIYLFDHNTGMTIY